MSRELKLALEGVARRVREFRLWVALALCWSGWALAGVLLLVVGVSQVALLAGLAALMLASGLACVVIALRSGRDLRGIARRVEAAHPDLDAALLTAVEDEVANPRDGRLGFLQQAVTMRAIEHHRSHDWGVVVPGRALIGARLAHMTALAALVVVGLVLAGRARPETTLFEGVAEMSPTDFEVTPGDAEIEKGSSLLVAARFPGNVPPDARLVVDGDSPGSASHAMTRSLEDPTFAGRLDSVLRDLSYHVEFAGRSSPAYKVHVFENPELTRTDAKLEFPSYTAMEPRTSEDVRHVTALEGTNLTLLFRLNKEVASAKLVDEAGKEIDLAPPTSPGSPVYSTRFTLQDSHRYKVRLLDRDGRTNKLAADLGVNVTRNRPPTIAMSQPGHDVRVSPLEELRLRAQASDDQGVLRHGVNITLAGGEARDVVLGQADRPGTKRVQLEHLIDFESLHAAPDQLVTYFAWAEDFGPDGKPRRTDGDMFFAEVRHFEEIFRQGEQPPAGSAENGQQGGNAQQAEQLAELQKEIINGTWKLLRRETGAKPSDKFAPDVKVLRASQESALTQAEALAEKLRDGASKASSQAARKAMKDAIRLLGEAADKSATGPLQQALSAEQLAYQSLLKLRAREHEVVRGNSRQRGGRGSGAGSIQRQLNQLELTDRENRFEEQRRARQESTKKEQEQREIRQVLSRLKELAQRQADLNERLKELQSALEAAKDEPAREEIQRQLKRLREQQQQVLRDTDELQERMENEQNRERMAESRPQVQDAREHARQASEALEQGRVSQALTEGTRAGERLSNVRDDLRKQSSNQFSGDLTEMRNQARQLDENQDQLTEKLDAWKESARQTLRDGADRGQLRQSLERQRAKLEELVERMRRTVTEAEETEPLLAKNLFDTARNVDEQMIPQTLKQAEQLADAGFADEAATSSRRAGEGIDGLREGVERAARSVLGDETAALRRAQGEVDDLAKQVNREIAQATGRDPTRVGREGAPSPDRRQGQDGRFSDQERPGDRQGQPNRQPGTQGVQPQAPGEAGRGQPQSDQQKGQERQGMEPGTEQGRSIDSSNSTEKIPVQEEGRQRGEGQGGRERPRSPGSLRGDPTDAIGRGRPGQPGGPSGTPADGREGGDNSRLGSLGGRPNGPGGPITGDGFRAWSDRMRDVEELLDDPALRAEAARIRDRVRGAREEFKRHAKTPNWDEMTSLVTNPIRELSLRIAEEVRRRESPDSLVPIDRDPVPPRFAEGVRRYRERLGSGR